MDSLENWVPTLSTAALFAVVLWLSRNWLIARLKSSIKFEYDTRLEDLRAELKRKESKLENQIRRREQDINDVRQTAIAALQNRESAVGERRFAAVDQLWASVIAMRKARASLQMMSVLKFEAVSEEIERDANLQQVMSVMFQDADFEIFADTGAQTARPFVTDLAWSIYSAYQAILMHAVAKQYLLKSGIDGRKFFNFEAATELVKAVLPHYSEYLDEHGDAVHHLLIDEVERLLLTELKSVYSGVGSDEESVNRAANILKLSNEVMKSAKGEEPSAGPSA
jgi:hypothetical protein